MTKFILKFANGLGSRRNNDDETGTNITIFQNKEPIGETAELEEAFAYIAFTIKKERIKNYKVIAIDRGNEEVLDFDHVEILKNSKKYEFDDEDDESENSDREDNDRDFDPRRNS
jgi:hypothetical protein